MRCQILVLLTLAFSIISSCTFSEKNEKEPLFIALGPDQTHIDFQNTLTSTNEFNIYKYRNFYNGGGVGLGDINNDGLLDIYLTGNMVPNKLYLNKGDFVFDDITNQAQIAGKRAWSTGVSMVDINGDSWLDIYVCNSGDVKGDNKQNEFFINNGDGTFSEKAEEMGLANRGFSTHAAFFDYDKDGDLDVYLLNNSYQSIGSFNLRKNERPIRDKLGGDKLLRNDGGRFIDVSEQAGIYGSVIGFGLGVSVSDLDKDGWMDLYISNDFFERDYIYMNNGDGTFREELEKQMRSISVASMGSDIADISGDGYPDVFVTEMLPEGDERFKTTMTFENWDKYQYNLENGYYHQFTRNMLHIHNGPIPDKGVTFSEVGRLAKVEATDWSWGALLTDLDNDGFKDIYITNGIAQDILNQDYLNYVANEEVVRAVTRDRGVDFKQLIDIIPTNRIPNYVYSGTPDLIFNDKTKEWGLDTPSHSNGAAYGDLDNDGDLDLVVNNVNMPLFVYQNQTDIASSKNNFLKVVLKGNDGNTTAIGAKVTLKDEGKLFYQEQSPNRGFQSSVDNRLNFGLGGLEIIDSLIVDWYYGKQTILTDVAANQTLVLREIEATTAPTGCKNNTVNRIFNEVSQLQGIGYAHKENVYSDFDRDRLLYHMKSTEGPRMSITDVNGDGLEDFYIGGAKDSPGALFIQTHEGSFKSTNESLLEKDKGSEDLQCLFFDADGDGDQDLYVTSGGNEFSSGAFALVDRLYLNDGFGNFSKSGQLLPGGTPESSSTVISADIDSDGHLDLFVGIRLKSGELGVPQNGYILKNDGNGNFTNSTGTIAPELMNIGMITDAVWSDYDSDGDDDLIIVGEWMAIRVFNNANGMFKEVTSNVGLTDTHGWWNRIEAADLDGDGDMDYVAGNHGLNSRFRASLEKPLTRYTNDFDQNGSVEQIISSYNGDKSYPLVLRHDLVMQLPSLKKKYLKYESYKGQTIDDIFTKEELEDALIEEVTMLESVILWNMGNGAFKIEALPNEAQLSPVYALLIEDIDNDGLKDMVLGGNLYNVKPEVGRYDASHGTVLKGLGKGKFKVIPTKESGLFLEGEIRDFQLIEIVGQKILLVARNNRAMQFFKF
ncbi:hypothetical protein ES765_16985 [Maribacter sp. ACAM166]|nr:hypothetical protein ES765_16985 [Maribacter sp. ACAM166]